MTAARIHGSKCTAPQSALPLPPLECQDAPAAAPGRTGFPGLRICPSRIRVCTEIRAVQASSKTRSRKEPAGAPGRPRPDGPIRVHPSLGRPEAGSGRVSRDRDCPVRSYGAFFLLPRSHLPTGILWALAPGPVLQTLLSLSLFSDRLRFFSPLPLLDFLSSLS